MGFAVGTTRLGELTSNTGDFDQGAGNDRPQQLRHCIEQARDPGDLLSDRIVETFRTIAALKQKSLADRKFGHPAS